MFPLRAFLLLLAGAAVLAAVEPAPDQGPEIHLWPLVQNETQADGKHRTLVLSLYHHTTNPDGSTYSRNILTYVESPDFRAILPLWFQLGPAEKRHSMLVPLWFHGPGYTAVPPLLSASWDRTGGGSDTWITPLVHLGRRADGSLEDVFAGLYAQGEGYQVLFPLAYRFGEGERTWTGVIPAWFSGPDWWCIPPALTASWRNEDGGSTTWVTPLAHVSTGGDGAARSWHVLNWWHDRDREVVFPLAWWGSGSTGVLPLWLGGRDWWCVPPALTAAWERPGGGRTLLATPLFHHSTDALGETDSFHALTWWHDRNNDFAFPLWFSGPDWWSVPLALSGGGEHPGGGRSDWITPLFHRSSDGAGGQARHIGPWFSGRSHDGGYEAVFPLWLHRWEGQRVHDVLLPLWYHGPDATVILPLLSARWTGADGATSTWITPLTHWRTRADGSLADRHVLTWFQGNQRDDTGSTDWNVVAPLWYHAERQEGDTRQAWSGLIPLWFTDPGGWSIPPALTWQRRQADGATSTWITPLYHRDTDAAGATTSMHLLTWLSWPDRDLVLPFFYRSGPPGAASTAVIPLWFANPEGWTIPLALSWQRQRADGGRSTWITPLFHHTSDGAGGYDLHAGPWLSARRADSGYQALLPLWYRHWQGDQVEHGLIPLWFSGPDFTVIPPALTVRWTGDDNSTSTWVTPLAHWRTRADGSLADRHVLTWFQGNARDEQGSTAWNVVAPLWYHAERQEGDTRQAWSGLIPLWFADPGGWVVPPALTWHRQCEDGGTSTWVTPLFHRDVGADGTTSSMHVLTWLSGRDRQAVLPLAWWKKDGTSINIVPAWFSGADWWSVPLALSGGWRREDGRRTDWFTPLVHVERDPAGTIDAWHALNWIHTPKADLVPPLLARWQREDGGTATWVTPLFHVGSDRDGQVHDWHALNWIHDRDTDIVFPLAWFSGPEGARHRNIIPFWFEGPDHLVVPPWYQVRHADGTVSRGLVPLWFASADWWCAPPLLTGAWTGADGRRTVLATPFFHRTTDAQGRLLHQHLLNWISSDGFDSVLPLYWSWRGDDGAQHNLLAPLWYHRRNPDGTGMTAILPPLFAYRASRRLDTSLPFQLIPFSVQSADDGHEINFIWHLFHRRRLGESTEYMVGPWWSEHRPDAPAQWQILGGLLGRDTDQRSRTSRSYALWGAIPLGGRSPFPEDQR